MNLVDDNFPVGSDSLSGRYGVKPHVENSRLQSILDEMSRVNEKMNEEKRRKSSRDIERELKKKVFGPNRSRWR